MGRRGVGGGGEGGEVVGGEEWCVYGAETKSAGDGMVRAHALGFRVWGVEFRILLFRV